MKKVKSKRGRMAAVVYTECNKLHAVKDKSQAIGEFLDWLSSQKLLIATYVGLRHHDDQLVPAWISIEKLLAQYFDIDLNKVEAERRRLLNFIKKDSK